MNRDVLIVIIKIFVIFIIIWLLYCGAIVYLLSTTILEIMDLISNSKDAKEILPDSVVVQLSQGIEAIDSLNVINIDELSLDSLVVTVGGDTIRWVE